MGLVKSAKVGREGARARAAGAARAGGRCLRTPVALLLKMAKFAPVGVAVAPNGSGRPGWGAP